MDWSRAQESRLLDPSVIGRLRELSGDELLGEMARVFRPLAAARIQALEEAAERGDRAALCEAAESLNETADRIGARRLAARTEELAARARWDGHDEWLELIAEIEDEARAVLRFLTD